MNRTLLGLLAATTLAAGMPAVAGAQDWGRDRGQDWGQDWGVNERQAQLDQRIDAGVRSGQLTASEAARLRAEFQDLSRLERQYRIGGLSVTERADLDRRFDALSSRIRDERRDWQAEGPRDGQWRNINQRQAQLERRIEAGERSGQLTRAEANRLRAEFRDLERLEQRYRRDGLSSAERADLDRRFDRLSESIRDERRDRQADRWENLNQRQAQFRQRLDRAVDDRRLTPRQAQNLRAEFDSIARLEQRYRQGGLTRAERADLDMRFDRLQANFRASVSASAYGHGYGQASNLFDYLFGLR